MDVTIALPKPYFYPTVLILTPSRGLFCFFGEIFLYTEEPKFCRISPPTISKSLFKLSDTHGGNPAAGGGGKTSAGYSLPGTACRRNAYKMHKQAVYA